MIYSDYRKQLSKLHLENQIIVIFNWRERLKKQKSDKLDYLEVGRVSE